MKLLMATIGLLGSNPSSLQCQRVAGCRALYKLAGPRAQEQMTVATTLQEQNSRIDLLYIRNPRLWPRTIPTLEPITWMPMPLGSPTTKQWTLATMVETYLYRRGCIPSNFYQYLKEEGPYRSSRMAFPLSKMQRFVSLRRNHKTKYSPIYTSRIIRVSSCSEQAADPL